MDCQAWVPGKYNGRESGEEESGVHWLLCDAYSQIRQNPDPETLATDRLQFLRKVQLVRAEQEK